MEIRFDDAAAAKIKAHLSPDKKLLLTFEDGVGPYSQHAMIHMQVQFTLNVVPVSDNAPEYDGTIDSNLGPIGYKSYSEEDLDAHMAVHLNERMNQLTLSGDIGIIDSNLGFIDFTSKDGLKNNPAR
ncbi:iron-sulfur cluster biosynthesis family protein [Lacticaseibacillus hulanensis]|uniref:iron-sulfur cluster biosynthesis family protein n=1 Tax=Lacticaseibacillus hulanensis TaxID=2493111 RepID=UPI000FDCAC9A|nr:iron-sulfur cluster biosynthesis family protein [Lacticaseibacillus hulanensis]